MFFNSLWSNDAIWWHWSSNGSGKNFVARRHQTITWTNADLTVLWHSPHGDFSWSAHELYPQRVFGYNTCKILLHITGTKELIHLLLSMRQTLKYCSCLNWETKPTTVCGSYIDVVLTLSIMRWAIANGFYFLQISSYYQCRKAEYVFTNIKVIHGDYKKKQRCQE